MKVMADWEPVLAYGTAPEGTQLVHRVRTPARSATMAEVPADFFSPVPARVTL